MDYRLVTGKRKIFYDFSLLRRPEELEKIRKNGRRNRKNRK